MADTIDENLKVTEEIYAAVERILRYKNGSKAEDLRLCSLAEDIDNLKKYAVFSYIALDRIVSELQHQNNAVTPDLKGMLQRHYQ